eukprot:m.46426 g.46426  ORF g.46426 m.46426 type:complete len:704 (-) comp6757_c0_seq1:118-2229(-)
MGCSTSSMAVDRVNIGKDKALQIRFWGTRGSIAKAGPDTVRFGGNTSCVEIRSQKALLIMDCGTGAHGLGQSLLKEYAGKPIKGHILITHTHWDHIQGVPFFAPLFVPGCEWDIYAPRGIGNSLQEALAGQMQYTYFPVQLDKLAATIRYHELVEGTFTIEDVTVKTQFINHPALTLGYRIESNGASACYLCDHEPFCREFALGHGDMNEHDHHHVKFMRKTDLCIHDAQYTPDEYAEKVGWGHTSIPCAIKLCRAGQVRRCALTHHDPMRTDKELAKLMEEAQALVADMDEPMEVFAAEEGMMISLLQNDHRRSTRAGSAISFPNALSSGPLCEYKVLTNIGNVLFKEHVHNALIADEASLIEVTNPSKLMELRLLEQPTLVILDQVASNGKAVEIARQLADVETEERPLIIITDRNDPARKQHVKGVDEFLVEPFTEQYARTRMRAAALRSTCRWMMAEVPDNEDERLKSLRDLGILDTPSDPRFDRITRVTAAALKVPIAVVSLVDHDRQWFKSIVGLDAKETSRDLAFCAHAILSPEPFIINDTLHDHRFADNPLVVDGPRIRFYAGCPLILPDGNRIGTLCTIDIVPRHFSDGQIRTLVDLTSMVVKEILRSGSEGMPNPAEFACKFETAAMKAEADAVPPLPFKLRTTDTNTELRTTTETTTITVSAAPTTSSTATTTIVDSTADVTTTVPRHESST